MNQNASKILLEQVEFGRVRLVTGERGKPFGERVIRASLIDIRKPGFFGYSEAHAKEDGPLGSFCGGRSSRGKTAKTEGLKSRQSDECSGSTEEMAAVEWSFHDGGALQAV